MTVDQSVATDRRRDFGFDARLWYAALIGPVAWSAHLLLVYWIASEWQFWNATTIKIVLWAVTIAVAILIALGMLLAFAGRGEQRPYDDPRVETYAGRTRFMREAGLAFGGYFIIGLAFALIPIIMLWVPS